MNRYDMTPQKIKRWQKQGRGQGDLSKYKPWLTHRDVSSKGWRLRIHGIVTGRQHELLSKQEAMLFRVLDLSPQTRDIKEQFPLDLDETLVIAKALGIKHPTDPHTGSYIVMTTDFLWCTDDEKIPIDSKPASELCKRGVINKFEIVRSYWTIHNRKWKLWIGSAMPTGLSKNCEKFHAKWYLDGMKINIKDVENIARTMTVQVYDCQKTLSNIAESIDKQFRFNEGTCLSVAFHFMARRYWDVDWYKPQVGNSIIDLLGHQKDFDFSKSFRRQWIKD